MWQCYRSDIEDIVNLKLPVYPAVYAIGIPDPLNILNANEVFIYTCSRCQFQYDEDVMVCRFPLMKRSAIVRARNVYCQLLFDYFDK